MAGEAAQAASTAPTPSEPGIYLAVRVGERLYQGEVLERVAEWVPFYKSNSRDDVDDAKPVIYALALVMTQDCDLAQDWGKRNGSEHEATELGSVLLCPVGKADEIRAAQNINSTLWDPIRKNLEPTHLRWMV